MRDRAYDSLEKSTAYEKHPRSSLTRDNEKIRETCYLGDHTLIYEGTKISMKRKQGGYGDCWINVRWRMTSILTNTRKRKKEKITAVTVVRGIYPLSVNLFVHTWNSTPQWYASLPHLSLTYAKRCPLQRITDATEKVEPPLTILHCFSPKTFASSSVKKFLWSLRVYILKCTVPRSYNTQFWPCPKLALYTLNELIIPPFASQYISLRLN